MRKIALLAVSALVVALGISGVASAIQGGQGISINLKSNKAGTAKKPRDVGRLTVMTTLTPAQGEAGTFATRTATIHFDKNLVFGGKAFKSCKIAKSADAAKCPKGSKIGTGSASAIVGTSPTPLRLTVTPYNGPGGKTIYLVAQGVGNSITGVLTGKLKNAGGGYGKKLIVTIPTNLQQVAPGTFATLTRFTVKISGVGKGKVPYVGLKGCTGGKVKIKGVFNFTDNTSKTATNSTSCRR